MDTNKLIKVLVALIVVAGFAASFGFWYYHSQTLGSNVVNRNPSNESNNLISESQPATSLIPAVRDCGVSVAPKLGIYDSNPVLTCLGESALSCENAKGILRDNFFPTIFEITKSGETCNFKLAYSVDSTLTYVTGESLAGHYISCPVNIVKAIDDSNTSSPKFVDPNKNDLNKYASQIYFYGTLALFMENNFDQNKIQSLGCSGEYIQSVIASYNLSEKK